MTWNQSKKAQEYLEKEGQHFQHVLQKVRQLQRLNEHFKAVIPENIRDLCYITNMQYDRITVVAANGSIATQLRFEGTDILRKLKNHDCFKYIKKIDCKVSPSLALPNKNPTGHQIKPLTKQSAQIIKDIADSIDDDRIRDALKRIAEYVDN